MSSPIEVAPKSLRPGRQEESSSGPQRQLSGMFEMSRRLSVLPVQHLLSGVTPMKSFSGDGLSADEIAELRRDGAVA